jgi:hypothetical protein
MTFVQGPEGSGTANHKQIYRENQHLRLECNGVEVLEDQQGGSAHAWSSRTWCKCSRQMDALAGAAYAGPGQVCGMRRGLNIKVQKKQCEI